MGEIKYKWVISRQSEATWLWRPIEKQEWGVDQRCALVELWALRDGLIFAKGENIPNLIVELDVLAVVHLMKKSNNNFSLEPLLTDCRLLLNMFPSLQVVHAYREANCCADTLARLGSSSVDSFILFSFLLPVVDQLCTLDKEGIFCNRLI